MDQDQNNEEKEIFRDFCPTGFCACCGEPNREPRRWEPVTVCRECLMMRTNDLVKIRNALQLRFKLREEELHHTGQKDINSS